MTFNPNDPKWTAYVLDELSPEERREVEQLLAQSPEARQLVDEIRFASDWLGEELQNEPSPALTEQSRSRILQRASRSRWLAWSSPTMLKAAALVVLVAGASLIYLETREPVRRMAGFVDEPLSGPSTQPEPQPQIESGQRELQAAQDRRRPAPEERQKEVQRSQAESLERDRPQQSEDNRRGEEARKIEQPAIGQDKKDTSRSDLPLNGRNVVDLQKIQPPPTRPSGSVDQYRNEYAAYEKERLPKGEKFSEQESSSEVGGTVSASPPASAAPSASLDSLADRPAAVPSPERYNREAYDPIQDNDFVRAIDNPLSTFSIDVDTASYANLRRFLSQGQRPPQDAVRIEEMINYFQYDYAPPSGEQPFAVHLEVASAPWAPRHRLLRVGLKGKEVSADERPAANLVFLIDVSGSMSSANKLPLLKQGMKLLVDELSDKDRVAITVYAGAAGLVLPSTPCTDKQTILGALERLQSGGSTAGAAGIRLAYQTAQQNFIEGGINRVILATDGDFNVGVSSDGELVRLIEDKRQTGVFLSVLGFGTGNYQDSKLEKLANKGNGNYAYVDSLREARKVLVEEMGGTLMTIAKDVKIQIEFNPQQVEAYRLIGYENRLLAAQDFSNDLKDAGEIGAGHTVTALYELIPPGEYAQIPAVDALRYQTPLRAAPDASLRDETALVKLRYKQPDGDTSQLIEFPLRDAGKNWQDASRDFMFAAGVAAFGMILRDSPHKGTASLDTVAELAESGMGRDPQGRRAEFLSLVKSSRGLLK